ncbi:MAG: YceI family protein [Bacteroidota bacterium]
MHTGNKAQTIDSQNSKISFSVKKLGFITVSGKISEMQGEILLLDEHLEHSYFRITIDPSIINTNNKKRDEHLRNSDFFDVVHYPNIVFKSQSITKNNDEYCVIGFLSILESSIKIEVNLKRTDNLFTGVFNINRHDFMLGKKIPSFIVGKQVAITVHCAVNAPKNV